MIGTVLSKHFFSTSISSVPYIAAVFYLPSTTALNGNNSWSIFNASVMKGTRSRDEKCKKESSWLIASCWLVKVGKRRCMLIIIREKQQKIMKNHSEEYYETSDSQPYHHPQPITPFLYTSEVLTHHFPINFLQRPMNETFQTLNYNLKVDQEFTKRIKTNILLHCKKPEKAAIRKQGPNYKWKENKKDCQKVKTKPSQKQSRNVYSNLLRIFFKCVIELRTYEALIQRILQNSNSKSTKEDFHGWLLGFNINFKNYIRSTQMKRILSTPGCEQFKKALMIVLRHYLNNHAVSHCLTSKRIELSSLKMHLSGLKELYREAIKMKLQIM